MRCIHSKVSSLSWAYRRSVQIAGSIQKLASARRTHVCLQRHTCVFLCKGIHVSFRYVIPFFQYVSIHVCIHTCLPCIPICLYLYIPTCLHPYLVFRYVLSPTGPASPSTLNSLRLRLPPPSPPHRRCRCRRPPWVPRQVKMEMIGADRPMPLTLFMPPPPPPRVPLLLRKMTTMTCTGLALPSP